MSDAAVAVGTGPPGVVWSDVAPPLAPPLLTGVPAFLGYAADGPVATPVPLARWSRYEPLFGPPEGARRLGHAVRGFFDNGGALCHVVRLRDGVPEAEALAEGLDAIGPLDAVDLVCVPDAVPPVADVAALETAVALQRLVLDHCTVRGDRFALLDAVNDDAAGTDAAERHRARLHSTHGALYHPWLKVAGPGGAAVAVPPCGHVAGVVARTDRRVGVHKAPANEVVEGVLDLRHAVGPDEVARLVAAGVNPIRAVPGRGVRVWGARTLEGDPVLGQVSVRRTFVTFARWLDQFLASLAFEPNDLRLWLRVTREVGAHCEDLFRGGALRGRSPEEAFYVKCDADTNPPSDAASGILVAEVGLATVSPAEFVVVRIAHNLSSPANQ